MRRSQLFTKTSKTTPADETVRNAQLLIQAGFIHKEMAGVYAYLPLGKRVLHNISTIVREEMNAIGGNEVWMTVLQPKDIWEKTGRWDDKKVDNWFKTKLANGTELGVGLTHEEPITDMLHEFVSSYRDMPVYIYQIGTKFRNELRAKSGLMRGREFLMKDLYSFSRDQKEHDAFYEKCAEAYMKVYSRLGIGDITYRTYASGGIFSQFSDEFQTLSHVGEDTIYLDETKRLAVNKEIYNDEILTQLGLKKDELVEKRAVEVGNIFPLGTKYADDLGVYYTDEHGKQQSIIMGCYGIGISRLMGLLAEHFADDKGLVWPENIAPAKVYLARLGEDPAVVKQADELYDSLMTAGVEVLYDDRPAVRAGEKFADADLLGIPYRVVISDKTVAGKFYELKARTSDTAGQVSAEELRKALGINS
ncbi:prolyl-tRNA synthetase [Candidatus Saccharibacteria bacterium CG_4_10_14_0_2_um_filter_52_9]|nr:MAG: prolyl-tRNA synthetase [Candidatus Saccharibacteria bacterium CG_4_10_14_0_2_um_filter_52_9]